jgi:integrase
VAKDRVVLHVLFSFGEELEIVEGNPVTSTTAPKGDKREPLIIDADGYENLLEACDPEARPMLWLYVLTLGETGLRCDSEALWLRWEDVDLERGFLTVESVRKGRRTKSGRVRRVPMTARLRDAMREHMAAFRLRAYHGERTPWVFHHELDRRHALAGSRLGGLRRAFASAVERAGLPSDLRQHDLRHRRVTTWLQDGKPMHLVQRAMGHSTIRVTEGYSHLVDNDLVALVEEPDRALRALTAEG